MMFEPHNNRNNIEQYLARHLGYPVALVEAKPLTQSSGIKIVAVLLVLYVLSKYSTMSAACWKLRQHIIHRMQAKLRILITKMVRERR